jgi:hypothetical protein
MRDTVVSSIEQILSPITLGHPNGTRPVSRDMDHNCEPLHQQGARGVSFQIKLASYRYVGKGTVEAFVPDLRHEGHKQTVKKSSSGWLHQVCLGNIDLKRTYYPDVEVRIIHTPPMSQDGPRLPTAPCSYLEILTDKYDNRRDS